MTPLFVHFSGRAWQHGQLDDIFTEFLRAAGVPEDTTKLFSMHSWRVCLACALLAASASTATILCMLRWKSTEALNIYARLNMDEYADEFALAGQAAISSVRTTSLSTLMQSVGPVDGTMVAAFQTAWADAASAASFDASIAARLPTHTEDDIICSLSNATPQLEAVMAEEDEA